MVALIVAYSKNRVIGSKGTIPWKIKGEQKRFKELTTGNVVVMGRKTFEDIGHAFPNRTNIVVSKTKTELENCYIAESFIDAVKMFSDKDIYIIGGYNLYLESLAYVDKMYITEIDLEVEGDTFFPEFDENDFVKTVEAEISGEIPYRYLTYTRKNII